MSVSQSRPALRTRIEPVPRTHAEPAAASTATVLRYGVGLLFIGLAYWPIARFLDTHASFTDELIERVPAFGTIMGFLTGWSEPLLRGWPMSQTAVLLAAWCAVGLVVYLLAVRRFRAIAPAAARWVLVLAFVFQVFWFVQPVLFTTDLFSYASYGEMQWRGLNPYTTIPLDLWWSRITWLIPPLWQDAPSIYGPLWNLMSRPIAMLVGSDPVAATLAYKLVANIFHAATVLVLWLALGRYGRGWQASGTALYAWNPAILLEFVTNGHNDVVMVAFLLAGVASMLAGWAPVALLAFAASIAVKYTSAIVLPFWLILWARRAPTLRIGLIRFFGGGTAVAGLVALCYLPYFQGIDTFGPVLHWLGGPMYANTIAEPLLWWSTTTLSPLFSWAEAPEALVGDLFRWTIRLAFAAYLLFELVRVRTFEDAVGATARAMTVFLLAVNTWVMPWYFLWAVAVVPLLGWQSRTTRWVVLTAACASAVIYFFHFSDRTVPVEGIHLLVMPTFAVAVVEIVDRFRSTAARVAWPKQAVVSDGAAKIDL